LKVGDDSTWLCRGLLVVQRSPSRIRYTAAMPLPRLQPLLSGSLATLIVATVCGCGLKGPLRLPQSDTQSPASAEESTQARRKERSGESQQAPAAGTPNPTQDTSPDR
jgi:predicted small lipoprotein YifL